MTSCLTENSQNWPDLIQPVAGPAKPHIRQSGSALQQVKSFQPDLIFWKFYKMWHHENCIEEFDLELLNASQPQESSFLVLRSFLSFSSFNKIFFIESSASVVLSARMQYLEPPTTFSTQHTLLMPQLPLDCKGMTSL